MPPGALWIAFAAPFVGALVVVLLPRRLERVSAGVAACAALVATVVMVGYGPAVLAGESVRVALPWIPRLGISADLLVDGFSFLFATLIAGMGTLIFVYGGYYLGSDEDHRRFFCVLLLFMGSMLGIVLAANLVAMFVFWELTTITSFLLIGFWHERETARAGALKSLVITVTGGLALFAGIVLLGIVGGSLDVVELRGARDALVGHDLYGVILVLVLAGAFTKSAQWPFHIWLPDAMEAPTPVSAYLHSATMVKAGLYLVARLTPVLGGTFEWGVLVTGFGLVTVVWGAFRATRQQDLKRLLAFSTVSQLGIIMALLGVGTRAAVAAAVWHLVNHAAFKGALFMLAGIVDHEAGTRRRDELPALRTTMPGTGFFVAITALSMAGVPLFGGFVSKEMALSAFFEEGAYVGAGLLALGSVLTVVYSLQLAHGVVWKGSDPSRSSHDPKWGFVLAPAILGGITILLGLAPGMGDALLAVSASDVHGSDIHPHLALWHGWTAALGTSAAVLVGGVLLYGAGALDRPLRRAAFTWDGLYEGFLVGLDRGARGLTYGHMSGRLRDYVAFVLLAFMSFQILGWVRAGGLPLPSLRASEVGFAEALVALAMVAFAFGTVRARTRLAAVLALGGVGFCLSLLFVFLGAPDLALTQLLVETVSVVLFLSVFVFLPVYRPSPFRPVTRVVRATASLATGLVVSLIVYASLSHRPFEPVSGYFLANSHDLAGGDNVVNVILVDFRGFDTLGEITVLGIAALGVFALIRLRVGDRR